MAEVCRKYRIRTVVVELSENESMDQLKELSNLIVFKPVQDSRFFRRGMPIRLQAYRYEGPIDPKMAEISLSKDLL